MFGVAQTMIQTEVPEASQQSSPDDLSLALDVGRVLLSVRSCSDQLELANPICVQHDQCLLADVYSHGQSGRRSAHSGREIYSASDISVPEMPPLRNQSTAGAEAPAFQQFPLPVAISHLDVSLVREAWFDLTAVLEPVARAQLQLSPHCLGGSSISALNVYEWHTLTQERRVQLAREGLSLLDRTNTLFTPEIQARVQYVMQMLEYLDISQNHIQATRDQVGRFLRPIGVVVAYAFARCSGINWQDWYRYVAQCDDAQPGGAWAQCDVIDQWRVSKRRKKLTLQHLIDCHQKYFSSVGDEVLRRDQWQAISDQHALETGAHRKLLFRFMDRNGQLTQSGKARLSEIRQMSGQSVSECIDAFEPDSVSSCTSSSSPESRRRESGKDRRLMPGKILMRQGSDTDQCSAVSEVLSIDSTSALDIESATDESD